MKQTEELREHLDRNIIIGRIIMSTTICLAFANLKNDIDKEKDIELLHKEIYDYLKDTFTITRKIKK